MNRSAGKFCAIGVPKDSEILRDRDSLDGDTIGLLH